MSLHSEKFKLILEPIGLLLIFAIFLVPTLAIINLSAETKYYPVAQELNNVKGVADIQKIPSDITLVGGIHHYITDEKMEIDQLDYNIYHATIQSRDAGNYSKPIIVLTNNTQSEITYNFSGEMATDKVTKIGLTFNSANHVLQDDGKAFPTALTLQPGEGIEIYLSINNKTSVLFADEVSIRIIAQ